MEAFPAVLGVSAAVVIYLVRRHSWKQTARRLGLQVAPGLVKLRMQGELKGFPVEISRADKHYLLEVNGRGKISGWLKLGAENLFTRTMAPDILTGDAAFDYDARITGDEAMSLAVLDHTTRQAVLREVVQGEAKVGNGKVVLKKRRLGDLERAVPGVLELARQLRLDENLVAESLATNAEHDPHQGVRLRNLRVLIEKNPAAETTKATCRRLLGAAQPELRLEAALSLGEEGREVVAEIAELTSCSEDLRVRAVESLLRPFAEGQVGPLMDRLLDDPSPRVRRAAIIGLGRGQHAPGAERLQELIPDADPRTAEEIAVALGRIGDPRGEPGLLLLLESSATRTRAAAVSALARVGTARAVEPLLSLTGLGISALSREARAAIQQIQSRISGAEQGQLSVAALDGPEGALSPAADGSDAAGSLSLADES